MTDQSLFISNQLQIPASELSYRYSRSGGPGGKHVNTSATQVELLWDVGASPSLMDGQRARACGQAGKPHRFGGRVARCFQRDAEPGAQPPGRDRAFRECCWQKALKPKRERIATAVPKAVKERRLQAKKWRG